MNLHPMAVAIVEDLIEEGRAGRKPFGIPLAVWKDAIEAKKQKQEVASVKDDQARR